MVLVLVAVLELRDYASEKSVSSMPKAL